MNLRNMENLFSVLTLMTQFMIFISLVESMMMFPTGSLLHRWENYSEVIILTGNGEDKYPEIEKYLSYNNIKYKGINCDSSVCVKGRKTYGNVYIDDRGGLPSVYKMLDKLITKIEKGEVVYNGI